MGCVDQPPLPDATTGAAPSTQRDRIVVLDVLRGMAILGMFIVHFWEIGFSFQAKGFVISAIRLLAQDKAFTTFAILFGAGFAIQLRQAQTRGKPSTARFLRRMLGLAAFGFVAHGIFGFNVLIGYAAWVVVL